MVALICFVLAVLVSAFKSKSRLEAENAVLRHQLIVLQRKIILALRLFRKGLSRQFERRRHFLPITVFKIISERLTTRFFNARFSCSQTSTANSIGVQSFGRRGQNVGEFLLGTVEIRECGTSLSRDQAGVQILSVADIAGKAARRC